MQQSGYGASQIHNHHHHQTQHHHLINDGDDDRRCPSSFLIATNSQNNHHLYHHPLQHQMFQPPPSPPSSHLTHQFINPYQTFHQPQQQQQQQQQLGLEVQDPCPNSHPFYDVNFKLGLEEDSGNNTDEQQQQQQSLIMPPPHCWHSSQKDSSAIKLQQQQLFCNVDKEPEMNSDHVMGTKYKRFGGELEEVCRITGSGSADVGVDNDRGSEKSLGGEVASLEKKVHHENEKKRKRKMKRKLSSMIVFFEGLVKQIMDHQEGLHKKFLEVVQRMDKEKTERDEAWRSEEATKYKRDAIARADEQTMASRREALIISYIEKITGQSINLPPITKPALSTESEATKEPTKEVKSRWPKAEVEALIQVRGSLDSRFSESGLKGPLWEEVSALMASMGYQRSAKRCKEKWENINKYFRKTKESGKRRSSQSKTCHYFDQLSQFYSRNVISLPSNPDMGFSNEGYPELLQAFVDARDLGKANEIEEFGQGSHGDEKENQEDEGSIDADKNGD